MFVNHVPYFMEKYGSLYPFQMEEVEQLNYVNKLVFYGASNHGNETYSVTEQVCEHIFAVCNIVMGKQFVRHPAGQNSPPPPNWYTERASSMGSMHPTVIRSCFELFKNYLKIKCESLSFVT